MIIPKNQNPKNTRLIRSINKLKTLQLAKGKEKEDILFGGKKIFVKETANSSLCLVEFMNVQGRQSVRQRKYMN